MLTKTPGHLAESVRLARYLWGRQAMKKLAVSTLAAALWLNGPAEAQSPFFQPAAPVQPVAARTAPAPQMPAGGVVPVRVHFGGALTRDGVMPVEFYTNQPAAMPAPSAGGGMRAQGVTRVQHEALPGPTRKTGDAPAEKIRPEAVAAEEAPHICDERFVAPEGHELYRPNRIPCGYRWYLVGEYLHWWTRPIESPPVLLVNGVPITANDVDTLDRQGARFTIGHWLNHPHTLWGLEGTIMFTGTRRSHATFASNGVDRLEHPFINAAVNAEDSLPVAIDAPALDPRSGVSEIETSSRLFGFEVNLRRELCRSSHGHFDMLIGYRQFHLDEAIAIRDRIVYDTAPVPLSDATVIGVDEFGTHNRIFAGQIGIDGELNWRKFYVNAWGKFAVGANHETIDVSGWTLVRPTPGRAAPPTGTKDLPGSVYSQLSNIGERDDNQLTVLPEVGVNVGYKLTSNWRVGAGYNFLYINNVVRPGDAIDTTLSPGQVPQLQPLGPTPGARPAPPSFLESAYWAHGLTVHMEFRY